MRLYEYFKAHRGVLYVVICVAAALSVWGASQIEFEEDVSQLFASTDGQQDIELAFSDLKVKDKVFILMTAREGAEADSRTLAEACDSFVSAVMAADSADGDIDNILATMDMTELLPALEYAKSAFPTLLDSTAICRIDSLITPQRLAAAMDNNVELLLGGDPVMFEVVRTDPFNLRSGLSGGKDMTDIMPYKVMDGHLFSKDSTTLIALCEPAFPSLDSKAGTRFCRKMDMAKQAVEAEYPSVEILYHGAPVQSVNNSSRIKSDLVMTLGISLLLICGIIAFCFRNWKSLILLVMPVLFGVVAALAALYLIQGKISLMALGIGAIVMGVAMSYSLHILCHYKYVNDAERVLRDEKKPVFLAGLTTIGAFLGLLFAGSPLLRDFGLFASLAVVGTVLTCLVFLPHFLRFENDRRRFSLLERVNDIRYDRKNWLIITIICISIGCIAVSGWVTFDSDMTHIGYKSDELIRSQELLKEKTSGGLHTQYYAVHARTLDSALVLNRRMDNVCRSLKEAGLIAGYSGSSALLVDSATQAARLSVWRDHFTPARISRIERMLSEECRRRGFEAELFSPFVSLLSGDYTPSSLYEAGVIPAPLMNNLIEKCGDEYMIFTPVTLDKENLRNVNDIMARHDRTVVLDPFYYTGNIVEAMHEDFNVILAFSSLFVLLVLFCAFRNIFLALIAFIPMSVSWYVVLGIMGVFGIQFNLINIIISTFIFGIGVDYSIFVMEGLLAEGRNDGGDWLLPIHKTAITLSAIMLVICMVSLLFARHPAISSIGLTSLIGMVSTIVLTYCIEPFVFRIFCQTRIGASIVKKAKEKRL